MRIERTHIDGVLVITPEKIHDARGYFSVTFRSEALRQAGAGDDWLQDNHVFSAERGVVRALHFQRPPFAQAKVMRVVRGAIYDVAVDIRRASPTYGQHVAVELSAENWKQLIVPVGFAHGYCSLVENTEVVYKVSSHWNGDAEGGVLWSDPDLAIAWPVSPERAICNARDKAWPRLKDLVTPF